MTSTIVTRVALGNISNKHYEKFLELFMTVIESGFGLTDLFPSMKAVRLITGLEAKLVKIHQQIDKIIEDIIEENQVEKQNLADSDDHGQQNLLKVLLQIQRRASPKIAITIDKGVIGVSKLDYCYLPHELILC
ncbi:hypothetical protein K1719_005522 [Acacia pycnantha]|nr:hypothetical protein K1719_005522 [Acacia pycnantha]